MGNKSKNVGLELGQFMNVGDLSLSLSPSIAFSIVGDIQ
jgi:hypothetical protein